MREQHDHSTADVFQTPRERRDDGMQRAVDHADHVEPTWSTMASDMLAEFLEMTPVAAKTGFLTEFFLDFARSRSLPDPPDRRAFGAVMNRAARKGLIVKSGYAEDRFCSPKTVWRKAIP